MNKKILIKGKIVNEMNKSNRENRSKNFESNSVGCLTDDSNMNRSINNLKSQRKEKDLKNKSNSSFPKNKNDDIFLTNILDMEENGKSLKFVLPKIAGDRVRNIKLLDQINRINNKNYSVSAFHKFALNNESKNITSNSPIIINKDVYDEEVGDVKNSLDVSSEDKIFDSLPEVELKYGLLEKKSGDLKNSTFNIKNKRIDKRTKLFYKIYNLDLDFFENLQKVKDNKKMSLLEYQNRLMAMVCNKLSNENLVKLAERLKEVRDQAEKVYALEKFNFEQIDLRINEAKAILKFRKKKIKSHFKSNKKSDAELEEEKKDIVLDINFKKIDFQSFKKSEKSMKSSAKKESKMDANINRMSNFLPKDLIEKFKSNLKIKS